jgi:hypothetical protein
MSRRSGRRFAGKDMRQFIGHRLPRKFTMHTACGMCPRMNRSVHLVRVYMQTRLGGPAEDNLR